MQQMQKMEAIGTLAGGIAHDFNNLLTVINGHAEMVLMQLDESHRARKSMQRIMTSGNRAKDLTAKLLAFSRRQYHQAKALNVNETLESFKNMVQGLLDDHVELEFMLAKDTAPINADPNQLEQILYNLTMNANDALAEVKDGKERSISIQSRMASKTEVQSVLEADMPKGDYVVITVNDTGVGIEPDALPKIFDPFFSTKEKGRGTGLGLATVYGIIKQNHGNIVIDSTPGQGTSVKVFWPVSREKLEEKKTPVEKPIQGGQETILLVEDDKEVREFNSSVLRNLGYNIIEADNGKSALAVYEESDKKIDLVLTDVIMPIMNGKELAQQLREKDRQIKIIFMSGYTDDQLSDRGDLLKDISFIQKPFSIKRLDGEIRSVLKPSSSAN